MLEELFKVASACGMENPSSTWRSHILGGVSAVVMAVVSIDIM